MSAKAEGVAKRPIARVGRVGADLRFRRIGVSLRDDDPNVTAFMEFYELVFIRNVLRPAEMKIEAETSPTLPEKP
jgi:hypothetical protein